MNEVIVAIFSKDKLYYRKKDHELKFLDVVGNLVGTAVVDLCIVFCYPFPKFVVQLFSVNIFSIAIITGQRTYQLLELFSILQRTKISYPI